MSAMSRFSSICLLIGFLCMTEHVFSMPAERESNAVAAPGEAERRATWLETRELEGEVTHVVYEALKKLVEMDLVNPSTIVAAKPVEKRGRHQGFCFRKTKSGRFLPYICWKEGDAEAK